MSFLRRLRIGLLWVAGGALPFCLVGFLYWWWRLGMFWTPDELPGIKFRFRLWLVLLGLALGVFSCLLAMRKRGKSPAG